MVKKIKKYSLKDIEWEIYSDYPVLIFKNQIHASGECRVLWEQVAFHVEYLKIYLGNAFIAHLW